LSKRINTEKAYISAADRQIEPNGRVDESVRISKIKWLNKSDDTLWIYKKIHQAFKTLNDDCYHFKLKGLESLQLTIYDGNEKGKYESHIDTTVLKIKNKKYIRKLSMSILLSDPENFSGGQLMVDRHGSDFIPEHKKGWAIVFPSFTRHRVFPVERGTRITLVAWAHGDFFV